ncbi:MAG: 50S ribosomal protein L23 [Alphaproteobacteria bacterium]|nr:MAG: 50S ribosomal protein L23 [Alphaproteobacteria bacterium]
MVNIFNSQNVYAGIRRPVVTEKSMAATTFGRYTFVVSPELTKTQIKGAIEDLYKVKVSSVSRLVRKGKKKVFRGRRGQRSDVSYAFVRLLSGSIDLGGQVV